MIKERPASFFDVPMLRYVGAKWKLADWIVSFFPDHDSYVEPFAGSAAVFFRKKVSPIEVLNDLNDDIFNFYQVLRERPEALIRAIELTPFSREEYRLSAKPAHSKLEKARRFYVKCWQSFAADVRSSSGWRYQTDLHRGTNITGEWSRTDGLWFAAKELKKAQIENLPALDVLARYDTEKTLFYIDPPYVLKSRSGGVGRKRYKFEMTDADHEELGEALNNIKGMAIVSGYASPLYEKIFSGWERHEKTATTNGNSKSLECIWLHPNNKKNIQKPQRTLFDL